MKKFLAKSVTSGGDVVAIVIDADNEDIARGVVESSEGFCGDYEIEEIEGMSVIKEELRKLKDEAIEIGELKFKVRFVKGLLKSGKQLLSIAEIKILLDEV